MKSMTRRFYLMSVAATLMLLSGCEVPTEATNDDDDGGSGGSTATITIWTSDSSPSPIAVRVNGSQVGVLTAFRTGAPACGANNSSGVITVQLNAGSHVIAANETQASGSWGPSSVTLSAGQCMTYELSG